MRGVSLNAYCASQLESCLQEAQGFSVSRKLKVIENLLKIFGSDLLGVVLFGSAARGEMRSSSDIDLLVILSDECAITRELYLKWDDDGDDFETPIINPHFVHLPNPLTQAGSLWLEASNEGIELLIIDSCVSDTLHQIKLFQENGVVERKITHGHPYWIWNKENIEQRNVDAE
ncbi:MAG: nucleotidyltransferase domain-containing protein [Deltaproteobacteria bacterium]|nr:nucleotidyltransferase domain-containing protein [Deltaproteobacteria bacterium]